MNFNAFTHKKSKAAYLKMKGKTEVFSNLVFLLFFLFFALSLLSCNISRLKTVNLLIERQGMKPVVIKAELAQSPQERNKGLMHRKKLAHGKGMLFIFDKDQIMSFWMKNTQIPLSIAFISSDGRILEIKNMQPFDTNSVYSSRSVRYALEVPQGWFTRMNINIGDKLVLDGIRKKTCLKD